MLVKVKKGVYFMQFPNLASFPELVHAVFTRRGGFSAAPYDSLNVSFGLGDDDARVRQNRELLARITANGAGLFAHQVHGTNVLSANAHAPRQGVPVPTGDALIRALNFSTTIPEMFTGPSQPAHILSDVNRYQ